MLGLTRQIKAGRPLTPAKIQFLFQLARDNVDSVVALLVVALLEQTYRFYEDGTPVERSFTAAPDSRLIVKKQGTLSTSMYVLRVRRSC